MITLANSKNPDEMFHNAAWNKEMLLYVAFQLGQTKLIFREINTIIMFLEILSCDPSTYTMDHPDFSVCSYMYMEKVH